MNIIKIFELIPDILNHVKRWNKQQTLEVLNGIEAEITDYNIRIPAAIVTESEDEFLKNKALNLITNTLDKRQACDGICRIWAETRNPVLEELVLRYKLISTTTIKLKVLTALKNDKPARVGVIGNYEVRALVEACRDKDRDIASRAEKLLWHVHESALEALVKVWAETRLPFLLDILSQKEYYPKSSLEARTLLQLRGDNWHDLTNCWVNILPFICEAAEGEPDFVATRACQILEELKNPKTIQGLCQLVIEKELPQAQAAALKAGYLPAEPQSRAIYYFITEQWDKYEILDFEQRYLRAAFDKGDPATRRRLAAKLRKSGRAEYLSALTGSDAKLSSPKITPEEASILVQLLTKEESWEKLWTLVFELPINGSIEAIRQLTKANWQPTQGDDLALYQQLQALIPAKINLEESTEFLPPAILKSTVRTSGRVNALAFSPDAPIIGLGTAKGHILFWNMQKAHVENVIKASSHSIGHMVYTPTGLLVFAERTNKLRENATYKLFGWNGERIFTIGEQREPIIKIVATENNLVVSLSRTGHVTLWDVRTGETKAATSSAGARTMSISPDGQLLALAGNYLEIFSLPSLYRVTRSSKPLPGVARCVSFSPAQNELITAHTGGDLVFSTFTTKRKLEANNKTHISWDGSQIRELASLATSDLFVSGKFNGKLEFIDWNMPQSAKQVQAPGSLLTSMVISPNNHIMATGDQDTSFSLWDLQILELKKLFRQALSNGNVTHLEALAAIFETNLKLPEELKAVLAYMEIVLKHRLRFEIELSEEPTLLFGEYDIELENL